MDDTLSVELPEVEALTYACAARECVAEATMMVPALRISAADSVRLGGIVLDPGAPFAVPLCDRHAREV